MAARTDSSSSLSIELFTIEFSGNKALPEDSASFVSTVPLVLSDGMLSVETEPERQCDRQSRVCDERFCLFRNQLATGANLNHQFEFDMSDQIPQATLILPASDHQRLAHPPLEAWAEMDRGVSIVVMESHGNRAASSGWMMRLVGLLVASE
jgi:hypothetical protein